VRAILALLAGAALAGCAAGLPVGETVAVPAARLGGAQGEAELVVRAFVEDAEGARREVRGADCEVSSILYAVRVTAPGRVRAPSFGAQSPTLRVACAAGGRRGVVEQRALTRWRGRPGGGWGWGGPFGPDPYHDPWGWDGPWGWNGPAYPVFLYPDVNVVLR
jgi:hypothetical protein